MNKHELRFLKLAEEVAISSKHPFFKIGAVVAHKSVLFAFSANEVKSHPLQKRMNIYRFPDDDSCKHFLHAEVSALLKAKRMKKDLTHATLFVVRKDGNGNLAIARPCPACLKVIALLGIKTIIYSTYNGFIKEDLP